VTAAGFGFIKGKRGFKGQPVQVAILDTSLDTSVIRSVYNSGCLKGSSVKEKIQFRKTLDTLDTLDTSL
jgi:hypothetical protein